MNTYEEMTRERIGYLAECYRDGDTDARNILMRNNIGLVKSIAVGTESLSYDDAVQAGWFGLDRAIWYYEPSKGSFSTFAGICIRQELDKANKKAQKQPAFEESLNATAYTNEYGDPTSFQESMDSHVDSPLDDMMSNDLLQCQMEALDRLDNEKKQLVIERFGLDGNRPKSLRQIGKKHKHSHDWVKARLEKALIELKQYIEFG